MKYALLFVLLCLVLGFDLTDRNDTGGDYEGPGSPASTKVNAESLPGYMGDMVIGDQRFESYLVPAILDESDIDLLTSTTLEWVAITSTIDRPDGSPQEQTVRKSTPYSVASNELVLGDEIRIWFRYTIGSGEIINNDVECERASFENDGIELQCIDGATLDEYAVHLVPRGQ